MHPTDTHPRHADDSPGRLELVETDSNAAQGGLCELLRPADVARRLGVSRSWLYDAAKAGRVPHVRLGGPDGPVRFVEADLLAWIADARAAWRPGMAAR
jgi:excisionase family DNA binding protein